MIAADSVTHKHILSVINTLITHAPSREYYRILDAGCGNGRLIKYLHHSLHLLHPDRKFVIYGFDVCDHGVQAENFVSGTIDFLLSSIPDINWSSRVFSLRSNDSWETAFANMKFDFIVSNQVLEHIHNKDSFFKNIKHHLVSDGISIHLAPLKHVIHEAHINLPFAHRINNFCFLFLYILILSRIGFGKYRYHKKLTSITLNKYAENHADYIFFWTNYSSESDTLNFARKHGMRADFRFSTEFYTSKLRQVLGFHCQYSYRFREYGFIDSVIVKLLRYVSSVTLICCNKNTYIH